jgi:hypothetical protein
MGTALVNEVTSSVAGEKVIPFKFAALYTGRGVA